MNTEAINLNVLPEEVINQIKNDLQEIKDGLSKKKEEDFADSFIDSKKNSKVVKHQPEDLAELQGQKKNSFHSVWL